MLPSNNHLAIATEGQDRPGNYYIRQGHATPVDDYPSAVALNNHRLAYKNFTDEKVVIMVRDPRDVAVSVQHHWGMESLEKAVHCMIHGEWPIPHGGGWVKWVQSWMDASEQTPVTWTRYENLSRYKKGELWYIIGKESLKIEIDALGEVFKRQSFQARRQWTEQYGDDLNYGKEFQLRFLRKGIVGDWVNHDWTSCYDLAMEHWGGMMEVLGYE